MSNGMYITAGILIMYICYALPLELSGSSDIERGSTEYYLGFTLEVGHAVGDREGG